MGETKIQWSSGGKKCFPRGIEHVHAAPQLNIMSGLQLSTAAEAMKRGKGQQ